MSPTSDEATQQARAHVREIIGRRGHAVDNAQDALARLEEAFEARHLQRTALLDQAILDLRQALAQHDGQRLGGKSGEAARFILRAIDRALDDA
jgi:hypothetical protein